MASATGRIPAEESRNPVGRPGEQERDEGVAQRRDEVLSDESGTPLETLRCAHLSTTLACP